MKELPTEVWTMIARLSKRQQPPPRVQANWNDDLNQQDLVSLMRVNKSMYQIVAPILDEEPIVQNIGLFFLGVEQPTSGHNEIDSQTDLVSQSETITDQSISYHKRHLLDLVKTLHVIRASSRLPVDKCYMEHWNSGRLDSAGDMDHVKCDTLARGELDGWILAGSLLSRLADQSDSKLRWDIAFPFISFRHLTALTFGLWDDGRWAIYEEKAHIRYEHDDRDRDSDDDSDDDDFYFNGKDTNEEDESASPYEPCENMLAAFFFRTLGRQAVNVCQHTNLGLNIFVAAPGPVQGLRAIHGCQDPGYARAHDGDVVFAGPTRIFSKYNQGEYDDRWSRAGNMHASHNERLANSFAAYSRLSDGGHSVLSLSLDICVLPEAGGADVDLQEVQIRAEIERGWERVVERLRGEHGPPERGGSGRTSRATLLYETIPLNVYVGDDVPPCPACGLKE